MSKGKKHTENKDYDLTALPAVLAKHQIQFSKTQSAKLVGGRTRLYELIKQGKIRCGKPSDSKNGKWYCDASDVIAYATL
jgi:hypothetical protein